MFIITVLGLTGIVAAPLYLRLIPEEYKASVLMFICGGIFLGFPAILPVMLSNTSATLALGETFQTITIWFFRIVGILFMVWSVIRFVYIKIRGVPDEQAQNS
jgi:uncharacterized membrane protein